MKTSDPVPPPEIRKRIAAARAAVAEAEARLEEAWDALREREADYHEAQVAAEVAETELASRRGKLRRLLDPGHWEQ